MNRSRSNIVALAAVAAWALRGCHDQSPPPAPAARILAASVTPADPAGRHLVVFTAGRVPADFGERAAQLGGVVGASLDSIGVAAVTGLSDGAAAELAAGTDIRAVEPDVAMPLPNEDVAADGAAADEAGGETPPPARSPAAATTGPVYPRQREPPAGLA